MVSFLFQFGEESFAIYDVADVVALPYLLAGGKSRDIEMQSLTLYLDKNGFSFHLIAHPCLSKM